MARSIRPVRLLLASMLLLLTAAAAPASGQGKPTTVVDPGESIQAAVDDATAGATIVVRAGTYREQVAITKDGITLRGKGAVLVPPTAPEPTPCTDPEDPEGTDGFCLLGQVDFETGEVADYAEDVTITGFTLRGFSASGIFALGARNATFAHNKAENNGEYGFFALASTGTRMLFNRASGSGEAGLYVGSSPDADATLVGNVTFDNQYGIFVRDALGGRIAANAVRGNCLGVLFLADAPGPAGEFSVRFNSIRRNDKACPASAEEDTPALSGIGVALVGARGVTVRRNQITGNRPSGETAFSGGVVAVTLPAEPGAPPASSPTDNTVQRNAILGNDPDIFWDETGTGNVFTRNLCETSAPDGLCH